MNYLIFNGEIDISNRNRQLGASQGCGLNPGDVTKFYFGGIKHPSLAQWALTVPVGQENILTIIEQANLQTYATLEAAGWFVATQNDAPL